MDDSKKPEAHLFICTNKREKGDSCGAQGGVELREALKTFAKDPVRGWDKRVRVNAAGCLGYCKEGVVAVLYPQGNWMKKLGPGSAGDLEQALDDVLGRKSED